MTYDRWSMIYYSAFVMDADTRRILLFRRSTARLWQTAHTSYRVVPKDEKANRIGVDEAFDSAFAITKNMEQNRVIYGPLFSLSIVNTKDFATSYEFGQIMPWDIDEALKINIDNRTREAIKKNIGLLMFFSDVDRDVWCNMQEFAHAPSR